MSTSTSRGPLAGLSGTILLAGAGKMGGAMLEGWLVLGLSPEHVAVIEPQPSREIAALCERGLRLNPSRDAAGDVAAVVVAVKPQMAPDLLPALRPGMTAAAEALMPGLGYRTWRHRARCAPACLPTRRIERRGNTVRMRQSRWRATPRIAGPMLRRRRQAPGRGDT